MTKQNKTLGGIKYKVAHGLPVSKRGWAGRAISDFLDSKEQCVYVSFDDDRRAASKYNALTRVVKNELYGLHDKLKVSRRGQDVYFRRLDASAVG